MDAGFNKKRSIDILHIKEKDWTADKTSCLEKCFIFLKGKSNG